MRRDLLIIEKVRSACREIQMSSHKYLLMKVSGQAVTVDQAKEIIVRTINLQKPSDTYQDHTKRGYYEALGFTESSFKIYGVMLQEEDKERVRKELSILDLEHLSNIIKGDGWCGIDGTIGASYMLRYVDYDKLLKEWQQIAEVWPFLNLTCKILTEEERETVWVFIVRNGKVIVPDETGGFYSRRDLYSDEFSEMVSFVRTKIANA